MSQHALIRGEVCFRAGDGILMPIPNGPVDIEMADDSVALGWSYDGTKSSAAIPIDEYERHVREGHIRLDD